MSDFTSSQTVVQAVESDQTEFFSDIEGPVAIPTAAPSPSQLPARSSAGAAGADVRAYIDQEIVILPGAVNLIPTGLYCAIPKGYVLQVCPRSGLALHHQVTIVNSPGIIDSDYRGEIQIILINHGKAPFIVKPNMRIAQLLLMPIQIPVFIPCQRHELSPTLRGAGGFGHTGIH